MDQLGHYIIDAVLALLAFLGKRQLDRMDRDRVDQAKKCDKQDEKIDALTAEAAAVIIGIDNLKNDHSETKGKLATISDKVDTNHSLVRDSLHDVRTLIGTKYITREEYHDFTHTVMEKLEKITAQIPQLSNSVSEQVTKNIRQMLSDMGVISRRAND